MIDKVIVLNNRVEMPRVGLGVSLALEREASNAVRWAIDAGYRHIDTAAAYDNEESVGIGIKESGISREELFIVTKLWNGDIRAGKTKEAFEKSLDKLKLDYLDLYLIHWPVDGYENAWCEMAELYSKGLAKSIGVCNFNPHHLDTLKKVSGIVPAVDQIELHPCLSQPKLRKDLAERGIACECWSPLGGIGARALDNPSIAKIAKNTERTSAQVVIRWALQHGLVTIPKSVHKDRIISNLDVFNFELSEDQMGAIDACDTGKRFGPDPDNFSF